MYEDIKSLDEKEAKRFVFLHSQKLESIKGLGSKSFNILREKGLNTFADLMRLSDEEFEHLDITKQARNILSESRNAVHELFFQKSNGMES